MPVLSDFTMIRGDSAVTIGDGLPTWETTFNTGGRESSSPAFLIFNVRGLTHTNVDVAVRINNAVVGHIRRYPGQDETASYWFTQMIAVDGSTLKDGNNELQINAVTFPGASNTNLFDDFELKDVVCFFPQAA
jgi:hypothetical protein